MNGMHQRELGGVAFSACIHCGVKEGKYANQLVMHTHNWAPLQWQTTMKGHETKVDRHHAQNLSCAGRQCRRSLDSTYMALYI